METPRRQISFDKYKYDSQRKFYSTFGNREDRNHKFDNS